ncbi:hypothetical protein BD311DRAFT_427306 [Dichomitus squalens]|uniref:Extracellular membrane protein CFEM domain-containing protein n=1 Tax=Dichomitus squalens TaxID=114155 RepID=A0A4Q9MKD6_9APHY|nr:hypothetical protein BD311DRAFT_427306 [Dichomitus squalens]TBU51907.1 hypothetical protein BD310DRAFT_276300 [Dichomitus squalens]
MDSTRLNIEQVRSSRQSLTYSNHAYRNFPCACHSEQFMPGAVNCMTTNCTQTDKEAGEATLNTACKAVGTSVSLPTSFSTGVPPISGSATTTITESTTGSSTSETDSPSSAPASSTASQPSVTVTQTTTAPPSSTTVSSTSISSETSSHTESTIIATSTAGNSSAGGSGNGSVIMTGGVSISGIMLAVLLATVGAVVSL